MWDNPRLLNVVAGALVGVAALAFAVMGSVLLLRSELFPVREIEIKTALKKTTRSEIESALRGRIGGNFFATSPDELRAALERLPWVRSASVRRTWPDRFEVALEEHVALARWAEASENAQPLALVSVYGERFFGRSEEKALPLFVGPRGSEQEVARRYARFAGIVAPLGARPQRVVLTPRYAWQLRLDNGLDIMLGRDADAAEVRLRRFVEVYEANLRKGGRHQYVDLRYPNGFALRIAESKG
jgi:cell division protein FtsQ